MQPEGELVLTWASYRRRAFGFMIDLGLLLAALIIVILALRVTGIDLSKLMFFLPLGLLLRDVKSIFDRGQEHISIKTRAERGFFILWI
ncbi:hypothetical protein [Paenibacillus sp. MBLB4367]|uniref:hypothetical protein n=1 Tax=Paenibacillus sp. MBLB4367 TaxID=3384767 RepID=UPI0039082AEE